MVIRIIDGMQFGRNPEFIFYSSLLWRRISSGIPLS